MDDRLFKNLATAMFVKGAKSDHTLLVCLENNEHSSDEFWSDPQVKSIIAFQTLVLRIVEEDNADDLERFNSLFHIREIPSLIVFGPNSPSITNSWAGALPSPDAFTAYFRPPPPVPKWRVQTKISLQASGRTLVREFPNSATVGELKAWIASELGSGISVIVAHRRAPLPDDDSLTMVEADLMQSAVLREEAKEQPLGDAEMLPPVRAERLPAPRGEGIGGMFMRKLRLVWSPLNPWDDEESDDFWEHQPHLEKAALIRRARRFIRFA
jgi:hypothetical protein